MPSWCGVIKAKLFCLDLSFGLFSSVKCIIMRYLYLANGHLGRRDFHETILCNKTLTPPRSCIMNMAYQGVALGPLHCILTRFVSVS